MGKGEISWKGESIDGLKRQVYAHRVGIEWRFFVRERRYDRWEPLPEPPLEDWIELLDGVQRRIARRLLRPEEEPRLRKMIAERFPSAKL